MSVTTVYAAEIIDTMAERWNLDQFTRTPIYIHGEVDDELVGWLEGQLPTNGYPCEHMGMGDEGNTACWSATEINRLRDENAKLLEENKRLMSVAVNHYIELLDSDDVLGQIMARKKLKELGIEEES